MDLKSLLSEDELTSIPGPALAKLEAGVKNETAKSDKRFKQLIETVGKKADAKIEAALESVSGKIDGAEVNQKMLRTLTDMAGMLEGLGLPATERTKALEQESAKLRHEMVVLNEKLAINANALKAAAKIEKILRELQGMAPDVVQAALAKFGNAEVDNMDVTTENLLKYIEGKDNDMPLKSANDYGTPTEQFNANMADITRELEADPFFSATPKSLVASANPKGLEKKPKRFESMGGERLMCSNPDVSYASLDGMGTQSSPYDTDREVADAFSAFAAMGFR